MRILACLDGLPAYAEYLDRGFAGTLPLPGYDVVCINNPTPYSLSLSTNHRNQLHRHWTAVS